MVREPLDENQPITAERREAVRTLLFQMLLANDPTLNVNAEIFRYQFTMPNGKVTIDFEPGDDFIDWAIRTSHRVVKETLERASEQLVAERKLSLEDAESYEVKTVIESETPEIVAASFAYVTMQNMIPKLKSGFYELGRESVKILEGIMFLSMKHSQFDEKAGYEIPSLTQHLADLSKELADTRKKQLIKTINRFTAKPRLDLLPRGYPEFLAIWQTIRKIYRANDESETWREMVKAKYPDIPFDDDLLTRITGNLDSLSDDVKAKLVETDGESTPSSIALEHCARLLGAQPYQHSTRHYHRLAKPTKKKTDQTEE